MLVIDFLLLGVKSGTGEAVLTPDGLIYLSFRAFWVDLYLTGISKFGRMSLDLTIYVMGYYCTTLVRFYEFDTIEHCWGCLPNSYELIEDYCSIKLFKEFFSDSSRLLFF